MWHIMIIGRKKEIETLENAYKDSAPHFML